MVRICLCPYLFVCLVRLVFSFIEISISFLLLSLLLHTHIHTSHTQYKKVGGDDEEQTMTSASYFDQKYSHIKITNPPMLLYTEHRVKYEEYDDHIFQIVERRKRGYNVHTAASSTASNGGRRGSLPTTSFVLKKNSKLLESKFKARRDKRIKNGINKGGNNNKRKDDENVVPLAKSSSVSADSVTDPVLAAAVC